jgi:hypothetical protein
MLEEALDAATHPRATAATRPGFEPPTHTPPATGTNTRGAVPTTSAFDMGAGDTVRTVCAVPSPT